jgi:hypothetical protein
MCKIFNAFKSVKVLSLVFMILVEALAFAAETSIPNPLDAPKSPQENIDLDRAADENQSPATGPAIGITAGLLTGIGFSYRDYSDLNQVKHFGGIFYGDDETFFVNFAHERLYPLARHGSSSFSWFLGSSVYYTFSKNSVCESKNKETGELEFNSCEVNSSDYRISVGPGLSFELGIRKGMSLVLELPLSLSYSFSSQSKESGISVYPIPAIVWQYHL